MLLATCIFLIALADDSHVVRHHCPADSLQAKELLAQHMSAFTWDADHHLNVAMNAMCKLVGGPQALANKTVLELGYGQAVVFGAIVRGLNAQSYNLDYSATPWISSLHVPFYRKLHARLREVAAAGTLGPHFNHRAAAAWSRSCGQQTDGVYVHVGTSEQLQGVPDSTIDFSVSNAVFEHIADAEATFAALARVTRLGGVTCHQVDMRHHVNFSRPWDFLLIPETQWKADYGIDHGNRLRLQEFLDAAHHQGWKTLSISVQAGPATAEARAYASQTLHELRQCTGCKYRNWPRYDLDGCTANDMPIVGVYFCAEFVGKPARSGKEKPLRGPCGEDNWSSPRNNRNPRTRFGGFNGLSCN